MGAGGVLGTSASHPEIKSAPLVVPASLCQVSQPRGTKAWAQVGLFYPDDNMGWGLTTGCRLIHETVTKARGTALRKELSWDTALLIRGH